MRRSAKSLRSVVRFVVWRERLSHEAVAWCAYGEVVRHGRLYAGGTMLLAKPGDAALWQIRETLILKFVEEAKSGKMASDKAALGWHGIPFAGFIRDLGR